MNFHVDQMRAALIKYRDTKPRYAERLAYARKWFSEEAIKLEEENIKKSMAADRAEVEDTIRSIAAVGRRRVEEWGKIDGSKLSDDVKLLDACLVDPVDFEMLKERHKDNATMLTALKKYGEKMNAAAAVDPSGNAPIYNVKNIVTTADKLNNWNKLEKTGLDVLDMIDGTGRYADNEADGWGSVIGKALSEETIRTFGEGESY